MVIIREDAMDSSKWWLSGMAGMEDMERTWGHSGSQAVHEDIWACQYVDAILEVKEDVWLSFQTAFMLFHFRIERFNPLFFVLIDSHLPAL